MQYLLLFLAVAIGYFVALFLDKKGVRQIPMFLAFSGAFLLSVTIFELIPEVFEAGAKSAGLYIVLGILLQIVLDFFSKGAEHGHVHIDSKDLSFPWLLFISLSIHALLEGFPVVDNTNMLIGVIVHKIPIAIILAFFFIQAGYSRVPTLLFLTFFAFMAPLGSLMAVELPDLQIYKTEINALAVGVFLHVSTTILFETSKDHKFNLAKLISIILGMALAYLL